MNVPGDTQASFRGRLGRVLVVEDDPFLRRALVRAVGGWGVAVVAVGTAEEAREALHTRFDLALVDVRLPDGDGIAIVRAASGQRPAPLVVAMSGSATAEDGWRLARAGAMAFLAKPVSIAVLEETVRRALEEPPPIDVLVAASVGIKPLREVQAEVRAVMIDQAMALAEGNQSEAARLLSVTRQALQQAVHGRRRPRKKRRPEPPSAD